VARDSVLQVFNPVAALLLLIERTVLVMLLQEAFARHPFAAAELTEVLLVLM
jgi:hypothetical protein